jgi:hypothetical protein
MGEGRSKLKPGEYRAADSMGITGDGDDSAGGSIGVSGTALDDSAVEETGDAPSGVDGRGFSDKLSTDSSHVGALD